MSNWSRVVNTTTKKFIRKVESNILRNRKLLAMLKEKGKITYGWSGTEMDWKVEMRRQLMDGYADGDTLTFARADRWKTATLGWRGYTMTDAMTVMEQAQNANTEAIIKVYATIAKNLMRDMEEAFNEELYLDGNLTANAKRIHGIESFMAGTFTNLSSPILTPNDTYAGLSTVLGTYGGTWSGTWPDGRGEVAYDFWSPLLVNYGSSYFSSTATWAANALQAMRYLIIKSKRSKSQTGALDLIMSDDTMYRSYLDVIDAKERITVTRDGAASTLVKLGFSDVTNLDGTDYTWEYGIPAGVGYGWNFDEMELRSMQSTLFDAIGPDYDIHSLSWKFAILFLGNAVFNPKFFSKLLLQTS